MLSFSVSSTLKTMTNSCPDAEAEAAEVVAEVIDPKPLLNAVHVPKAIAKAD